MKILELRRHQIFMDKSFLEIEEVQQAMDRLKYISADDETRAIADLRQNTINDYNSGMAVASETGLAEGKAAGIAEGKAEKARETALKLLSKGMDIEDIAEVTWLSNDEINSLKH
ncbi:hypothetical protein FACS189472_01870 [Alphaproteobacteria bacterium]|nr:hypothetical protein FACS189472_01870 [Alphaproteobacteria bacterium]